MSGAPAKVPIWRSPLFVLIAAAFIVLTAFGIRQSFGLFMRPITLDLGWGREILSLSFATQNLMIGIAVPFAGALADRWGAPRTVALGGALFGLGILVMSQSTAPIWMFTGAGLLAGLGLSSCGLPLMLAVVGQVAPADKRSLWLGIVTACATGGQLAIVPISQSLITGYDWVVALLVLSVLAGLIVPMAFSMTAAITPETGKDTQMSLGEALREAARHRGYLLLSLGFFVCGFHVAFITIHLPAYLVDQGISPALGATALMLIALFNMIGSWTSGWLAGKVSKKYLLSTIYVVRSIIIFLFIMLPIGPVTVMLFSAALGFVWLSTVPPTSGLVAQIFGVRYMGVLFGIVYLSHQFGSFAGVWLGGRIFDTTGNYDVIWWSAIALGLLSALLHLPINDLPVKRLAEAAAQ